MELLNMNLSTQKILVNYVRTIHKTHYVLFSQLEVKELPKLISLDQLMVNPLHQELLQQILGSGVTNKKLENLKNKQIRSQILQVIIVMKILMILLALVFHHLHHKMG
jgi:hypothetical protein